MNDEAVRRASAALAVREVEWHRHGTERCDVDWEAAARIALQAAATALRAGPDARAAALRGRVARLRKLLARYDAVAEAAQRARIWDYAAYEDIPDDQWLAIDRESVEQLMRSLGAVDRWHPWATVLERRLGDV